MKQQKEGNNVLDLRKEKINQQNEIDELKKEIDLLKTKRDSIETKEKLNSDKTL